MPHKSWSSKARIWQIGSIIHYCEGGGVIAIDVLLKTFAATGDKLLGNVGRSATFSRPYRQLNGEFVKGDNVDADK